MMKRENKSLRITALAPVLLFAVFASCVVIVLLFGADNYQTLTRRDRESYQYRTAVQYLTTRIRQGDVVGMVFVGDFDEAAPKESGDTVYIRETVGDRVFYTRIYCHDGYLCELFAEEASGPAPEEGERILPAERIQISRDGDRLRFELVFADSETVVFWVTCRTGKETL